MRGLSGLRIATIRGVDLKIHFSLLFLLVYVVFVAAAQLPFVIRQSGVDPGAIGGTPFLWGLAFAVGLFASVVLHEFGHVLMAQSLGVKVRGVTLMMLGGVSEMERIPEHRFAEFKVAVVGPIVSFAIAAALLGARALIPSEEVNVLAFWLARVNLALGVFNLLPAFPLDGGRAFRSLLASRFGMIQATGTVVRVAKGLSWVLGIIGLLSFNFLLVLVAFFVYSAAQSEWVLLLTRHMLKDVTAGDVGVTTDVLLEEQSLASAAQTMIATRNAFLPVETREGGAGILGFARVRRVPKSRWGAIRVKDLMERVPAAVDASERIEKILMDLASLGALPLAQGDRIVGVLRYRDVAELMEFQSLEKDSEDDSFRRAA